MTFDSVTATTLSPEAPGHPTTVLIADDSPLIRARLALLLAGETGVEVIGEARDAPETVAALHWWRPDVLILDWGMPGGGGLKVLRDMRQDRWDTAVIVLTNHVDDQYRARALALGAHCLLDKTSEFVHIRRLVLELAGPARPPIQSYSTLKATTA